MRSAFPALHDRMLTTILVGAVVLLIATVVAIAMGAAETDGPEPVDGPPIWMTGATPPSN